MRYEFGWGIVGYESRAALASKIDWEGGIYGFLQYGFDPVEVPTGDIELHDAATTMMICWYQVRQAADRFMSMLPDPSEDDDAA